MSWILHLGVPERRRDHRQVFAEFAGHVAGIVTRRGGR